MVAPSARVRPVAWHVDGVAYDDATAFVAPFGSFPDHPHHPEWQVFALIGVLVAGAGTATLGIGSRRDLRVARAANLARIDAATGVTLLVIGFTLATVAAALAA